MQSDSAVNGSGHGGELFELCFQQELLIRICTIINFDTLIVKQTMEPCNGSLQ